MSPSIENCLNFSKDPCFCWKKNNWLYRWLKKVCMSNIRYNNALEAIFPSFFTLFIFVCTEIHFFVTPLLLLQFVGVRFCVFVSFIVFSGDGAVKGRRSGGFDSMYSVRASRTDRGWWASLMDRSLVNAARSPADSVSGRRRRRSSSS